MSIPKSKVPTLSTNFVDRTYVKLVERTKRFGDYLTPYLRRILRFLALPYCYFFLVDWEECTSSRYQVFKDFIFIFFRLKYFPDNYSLCRLYSLDRKEWYAYYGSIYEPYQRARLRKEVQPKEYQILFQDKFVCYQLCLANGLPLPRNFGLVGPDRDFRTRFRDVFEKHGVEKIIVKPVTGRGGNGIVVVFQRGAEMIVRTLNEEIPLDDFHLEGSCEIQEFITQHPDLAKIARSTNTVRIATLLTRDDEVIPIGAFMRFGAGDAFIDNRSSGGMGAGIDMETGILGKFAYDFHHKRHLEHPTSNVRFEGVRIPFWREIVELAKRTQQCFPMFKLLGQDIAITADGPVIIEINEGHDNVGMEQAFGPILRDERVRSEFEKYGLLINRHMRDLR